MSAPPSPGLPTSLSINFTGWNALKTVAYARKIVVKLTDHPAFPEPWPNWVASLGLLTEKSNTLEVVNLESESRDKYKVTQRNILNEELKKDMRSAVQHVELAAQGKVDLLHSLGLNMRQVPVRKNIHQAMLAPQLTVVQSKESGTLSGKVVKCPGAQVYEVQITEGDPTVEENWIRVDVFSKQNFQVTGRVPGKTYSLRARCYGHNGTGPWSSVATLISL